MSRLYEIHMNDAGRWVFQRSVEAPSRRAAIRQLFGRGPRGTSGMPHGIRVRLVR